jgi:hypothetical protein
MGNFGKQSCINPRTLRQARVKGFAECHRLSVSHGKIGVDSASTAAVEVRARRGRQYGDFDGLRVAGKSVTAKLPPADCAVTQIWQA